MRLFSVIIAAFICACSASTAGDRKEPASSSDNSLQKVLIELFTSQGCSSCPSADRLVSSLAQTDTNLVVLSFHVDYWDRLGWKDVFSCHDNTLRQQQYAQALHAESVYTPQAVVQGQYEMVGSNKPGITNALSKIRENNDGITITVNTAENNHNITLNYEVSQLPANHHLIAALVQTHTSTDIARGENSGVQLSGYNVVRKFVATNLAAKTGSLSFALPGDLNISNASVVVFIQDMSSGKIKAVTQLKI